MQRPDPWYDDGSDKEPGDFGWVWMDWEDNLHGPYPNRRAAIEAIDRYMLDNGLPP